MGGKCPKNLSYLRFHFCRLYIVLKSIGRIFFRPHTVSHVLIIHHTKTLQHTSNPYLAGPCQNAVPVGAPVYTYWWHLTAFNRHYYLIKVHRQWIDNRTQMRINNQHFALKTTPFSNQVPMTQTRALIGIKVRISMESHRVSCYTWGHSLYRLNTRVEGSRHYRDHRTVL